MLSESEKDVVIKHAFENEENLRIALVVGAAYQELCGRIIATFLEAVRTQLRSLLSNDWQLTIKSDTEPITTKSAEVIVCRYSKHLAGIRVVLAAEEWRPYLALRCDNHSLCESLKQTVDQEYRAGSKGAVSLWYWYVDKVYSGWSAGDPDSLIRLYRKAEAVTYFTENIEKLVQVVENWARSHAASGAS
jgi:hypothetical protein